MIHKTKKLTNTDIKRYFDTKNTENINIYYYTTLRKKNTTNRSSQYGA